MQSGATAPKEDHVKKDWFGEGYEMLKRAMTADNLGKKGNADKTREARAVARAHFLIAPMCWKGARPRLGHWRGRLYDQAVGVHETRALCPPGHETVQPGTGIADGRDTACDHPALSPCGCLCL